MSASDGNGSPPDAALFDTVPCGLLRTTEKGVITRVNRTFTNWTGYSTEELVGHKQLSELLAVGGRIFHQTHWLPLLQMQGSVSEVKFSVVKRDGEIVPMVFNAVVINDNGETAHEIATFVARDRDAYERELLDARRRLEDAAREEARLHALASDRALLAEQMIGIVSHDLRTPLSTIVMGANLLEKTGISEQQQRILERMVRGADQSMRLIGDLLDFTQARLGGGLSVDRAPIQIHALVQQTVEELALLYSGHELRFESSGNGEVEADSRRIAQLLGNLVANAVTYGSDDAPVTVRSTTDAETCSLEVHNLGTPIPEDLQGVIFSPMKRASSHSGSGGNIGLGLFIVEKIAGAHGGTASVISREDEGTTFLVTFPKVAPSSS